MLNFDQFVAGYITCAAWASVSVNPETEEVEELDQFEYAPETLIELREQCSAFYNDAEIMPLLDQASEFRRSDYLGHDFWLTRNGHGTGFWDRDELGDLGQVLSEKCGWRKNYPECHLYIGDDGLIYLV